MSSIVQPILCAKNIHPRDQYIKFYEKNHKYEILTDSTSKYTSVTTWIQEHFPKFNADDVIKKIVEGKNWGPTNKYWGMTADEIKKSWSSKGTEAAEAGTNIHNKIEQFMNKDLQEENDYNYYHAQLLELYNNELNSHPELYPKKLVESSEWKYFIEFVGAFPELKPYRTEWMIYDEHVKLSGSIDMVYENIDGTLSIYDWKRSKEIIKSTSWNEFATNPIISYVPSTNYWKYALQLNTYRTIIERNYGKQVKELFLVKLHPNNAHNTYELLKVPLLNDEMNNLFEERLSKITAIIV